ncbi:MAG: hypothetical protein GY859_36985 [Desulfobacterales bacterium]|nr:hypothetical protein [Desulfobacterales bacterium]
MPTRSDHTTLRPLKTIPGPAANESSEPNESSGSSELNGSSGSSESSESSGASESSGSSGSSGASGASGLNVSKKHDDALYIDKLTGVYLSKTIHEEDQPSHLIIHDPDLCVNECYPRYGAPCTRFCPAQVYEMDVDEETGKRRLKLNPSNCYHCKTCDIKDPYGNITWTCPEGGGGPGFTVM